MGTNAARGWSDCGGSGTAACTGGAEDAVDLAKSRSRVTMAFKSDGDIVVF